MKPILFSIGPVAISSFGFFAAISFLTACFLIWKFSQERLLYSQSPIEDEDLFDALFVFTLSFLFGARMVFVFSHFNQFGFNLLAWLLIERVNGFSFLGGFLVGVLSLFLFCQRKKLKAWEVFDLFGLGLSAALSLSFIGALLDGVGGGRKTLLPWGVLLAGYEGRRHPVQGLAAILFFFLFLFLNRVRVWGFKKKLKSGLVALSFLALSSLILFGLEFLKESKLYWRLINQSQVFYLVGFLIGGAGLYLRLERNLRSDLKNLRLIFKRKRKNG